MVKWLDVMDLGLVLEIFDFYEYSVEKGLKYLDYRGKNSFKSGF